jgi:glucose-6-phosphate dehydrogenase assembly protein OpcA
MTEALKVLAQSYPASSTLTDAYVVPAATSAVVSSITACNQGSVKDLIRISVAVAGAADTPAQYVYYDTTVLPNDTLAATIGATLAAATVVRVRSFLGTTSFNIFGAEES